MFHPEGKEDLKKKKEVKDLGYGSKYKLGHWTTYSKANFIL
jgi:hypothetical protein